MYSRASMCSGGQMCFMIVEKGDCVTLMNVCEAFCPLTELIVIICQMFVQILLYSKTLLNITSMHFIPGSKNLGSYYPC